jgi:glycosyltransferase involved in cell wall biosynthesis
MLGASRIFVIVPAFREAPHIGAVLRTMPAFVDRVVVVDDHSPDATWEAARAVPDARVELIRHEENRGVGAAIVTGYRHALASPGGPTDALCVMAGDGQMDPADLARVATPVATGAADYVKGNRFARLDTLRAMPPGRIIGGVAFSVATRWATGLRVWDSKCGYTALARAAAGRLPLGEVWPGYGYPNDLLGHAAAQGLRVVEVPVRAVYANETSGLRARHLIGIARVVGRTWRRRRDPPAPQ